MSVNLQIDKCIEQALPILQRLERAGFEAWIVGGTVRELLRGQMRQSDRTNLQPPPLTDIDITTSARPDQTLQVFSDFKVIETGLKHGTVTVLGEGETGDGSLSHPGETENRPLSHLSHNFARKNSRSNGKSTFPFSDIL